MSLQRSSQTKSRDDTLLTSRTIKLKASTLFHLPEHKFGLVLELDRMGAYYQALAALPSWRLQAHFE